LIVRKFAQLPKIARGLAGRIPVASDKRANAVTFWQLLQERAALAWAIACSAIGIRERTPRPFYSFSLRQGKVASAAGHNKLSILLSKLRSPFRTSVSCLTAVAFLLAQMPAPRAAPDLTRADYEACQAQNEEGFRRAIEALTLKGLEAGVAKLDYASFPCRYAGPHFMASNLTGRRIEPV
jgi:hypothetical protein